VPASDDTAVIVGVVSQGFKCDTELHRKLPGIFTRVAAYLPWIKTNMK
jgi:secreted trypsin-like serine protease